MKRKKKILSIGSQLLLWIILTFFLLYIIYDTKATFITQFLATLVVTGLTVLPSIVSVKILIPKFLYQKKIRKFIIALLLIALTNTLITYIIAGAFYYVLSGKSVFRSIEVIGLLALSFFAVNCIVITISSAVQIIIYHFSIEQQLYRAEREKMLTELDFLRMQINPHFLFNVLNIIYFQIQKENSDARNSLEKLSEMLRYQLYECTSDKIEISRELSYIENYVKLQQLRMEIGTDLQMNISQHIGSFKIAPLLILPLIENAFKHLSNYKNPSLNKLFITMSSEQEGEFFIKVVNTYNSLNYSEKVKNSSGLGLQNLERRLSLLYPGKHSLTKRRDESTYETVLKIIYDD